MVKIASEYSPMTKIDDSRDYSRKLDIEKYREKG